MVHRNGKSKCLYKFNVMLQALSQVETIIPKLRIHVQVFCAVEKSNTSLSIFRGFMWLRLGFEVFFLVGWCFDLLFWFCFLLNYSKRLLPFFSQMLQVTSKKLSEFEI